MADEFNRFFVSVGQNTVDKIKSLANECGFKYNESLTPSQYPSSEQFSFSITDSEEIDRIITSMSSSKGPRD